MYRKLTEADASSYWALRLQALELEPLAFGMSPEEHRLTTVGSVAVQMSNGSGFFIGAFDDVTLVGIARFAREQNIKERHKGHIYGVYVASSQRGKGVAQQMLAALISAAKDESGLEHLLLSVSVHNKKARALYQAVGFVGYGIEPRALRHGDTFVDEEHMVLMLRDYKAAGLEFVT